jgi:hypothetical protein
MNKIKISILCPTRKRPKFMRRLVEKCYETCMYPDIVEIVFGIDDDDKESLAMVKSLQEEFSKNHIEHIIFPRNKYMFSDLVNQVAKAAKGEIFGLMSDDAHHDSKNWDEIVIKYFDDHSDKIFVLQTLGGLTDYGSFPFMHRNWINTVGYLMAPIFNGDWADVWLKHVAMEIGENRFIVCKKITIPHLHVENGKMPRDETYSSRFEVRQEQEKLGKSPDGNHPYHGKIGREMRELEIKKLKQFIENFKG